MDVFEVARFSTIIEAEAAVALLLSRGIDARLPDRIALTMYPFWQEAFGGLRVLAPADQIASARALIAKARAGELRDDGADDWRVDAIPGKIGDLDVQDVRGVITNMGPTARRVIICWLIFMAAVFVLAWIGG